MRADVVLVIAVVALPAMDARACSPPPGYEIVETPAPSIESRERIPPSPRIRLESLVRGFDDDGTEDCSDVGVLTLIVEDAAGNEGTAYFVAVSDGRAPDALLPDRLITPIVLESGELGFVFRWLDLPLGATTLEPIVATIEVRRISQFGQASAPASVRVAHAGGAPPPKPYSRTIAALQRATEIAIVLLVPLFLLAYLRQRWRLRRALRQLSGAQGTKETHREP